LNELIAEGQDLGPTHRKARLALAESLRTSAREIKKKYIQPHLGTTDFGLLFLPAEALYLEAMKHPQLSLLLEQERIYLCSPQTLSGFLQLLQMVEQRSELAANAEAMMLEMKRARRLLDLLNDRLEETSKHLRKAGESNQSALTHFYRLSERLERPSPPTAETSPEARTKGTSSDLPL
jgi:DNA recombination protein RmuC